MPCKRRDLVAKLKKLGFESHNLNSEICLVYLAWIPLGLEPFKRFLSSYLSHDHGVCHKFLIVFNGHSEDLQLTEYQSMVRTIPHEEIIIPSPGFDIGSYRIAASRQDSEFICFLNSYSEILAPGWLALMLWHLSQPGVGVVGASGNLISWYTNLVTDWEQLKTHAVYRGPVGRIRLQLRMALYRALFPPFPNLHLRTNAFLISRRLFLGLRHWPRFGKLDTYRFESGRTGMTRQILNRGLGVRVVGKDGRGFPPEEWAESRTYWQGSQENLLVADNQTSRFAAADEVTRRHLTRIAWGDSTRV
jgi:hypothetical protein